MLWPRVDQKTALKCIDAAGLVPWPVELQAAPLLDPRTGRKVKGSAARHPYYLQVDMEDMEAALAAAGGPARVLCVLATTSCFCPRLPDPVLELSRFCHRHGIALVVNNAYGVQSNESTMRSLEAALQLAARTDKNSSSSSNSRKPNNPTAAAHAEVKDEGGRLDYIVQSSDKNFLVPVGGAVVTSHSAAAVASVAALYAGRASAAPVLDLFITALAMGRRGMRELWSERYKLLAVMMDRLRVFAKERDEELVEEHMADGQAAQAVEGSDGETKINQRPARNDISLAITIKHYWKHLNATEHVTVEEDEEATAVAVEDGHNSAQASGGVSALTQRRVVAAKQLGARLFRSGVTGPRVVLPSPDSGTTIVKQHNHTSNPRNHCNGNTKASSLVPEAEEWIEQRPRVTFYSYGSHHDSQLKVPLLVCACAIGMTHADLNGLMAKLEDLWPVDTHTRK